MNIIRILILSVLAIPSISRADAPIGKGWFSDSIEILKGTLSCDQVYRISIPLKQENSRAVVIFAVPTYAQVKAASARDPVEYAISKSRILVGVFNGSELTFYREMKLGPEIFKRITVAIIRSEAYSLPEKTSIGEEYVSVSVLDSGVIELEAWTPRWKNVRISRTKGEAVAVDYLAEQVWRLVDEQMPEIAKLYN